MRPDELFETPVAAPSTLSMKEFLTPNDLTQWADRQHAFYAALMQPPNNKDQALLQATQGILSWFTRPTRELQKLPAGTQTQEQYANSFKRLFERYRSSELYESESVIGQYLTELKQRDHEIAARVAVSLTNTAFQLVNTDRTAEWLRAGGVAAMAKGAVDLGKPAETSFDIFRQHWDARFGELLASASENQTSSRHGLQVIQEQSAEWSSKIDEFKTAFADMNVSLKQGTQNEIDSAKKTLADFTSTYNQALALRAPTNYWAEKCTGHRKAAGWWFFGFVVASVATVYRLCDAASAASSPSRRWRRLGSPWL